MNNENNSYIINSAQKSDLRSNPLSKAKTPYNTAIKPSMNTIDSIFDKSYDENLDDILEEVVEEQDCEFDANYRKVNKDQFFSPEELNNIKNVNSSNFFIFQEQLPQHNNIDLNQCEEIYSQDYLENDRIYDDKYLSLMDAKLSKKGIVPNSLFSDCFRENNKDIIENLRIKNNNDIIPTPNFPSQSHNNN